ncbi:MAG: hypothetical protein LBK73_03420 [Treponema sp.]|jgi:hypothetical protein|nr:hypothetical protein [Treponema sp.]
MTLFIKIPQKIVFFSLFAFLVYGCVYTKSGNAGVFNRDIAVTAASGSVYIQISGRISEDIYANQHDDIKKLKEGVYEIKEPLIAQGTKTINQNILLYESQTFRYSLTTAEVVIMTIRSVDGEDAQLLVYEYGKSKKYTIRGGNQVGRVVSFKN